jgi:hypothetical protein
LGTRETFALRQDYPATYNASEIYPWASIDFKREPERYMGAVLMYCLEGNVDVDFKVQNNKLRNWYHAPWLHDDGRETGNGREYWHGLTRERASLPGEIHMKQDTELENWAIGFYNEPGGYTVGRVWPNDSAPVPSQSTFPEGTVSFKLLFTSGTVEKVPFLAGTKEWKANIYPCNPRNPVPSCPDAKKRVDQTVRLLQIDIAIKDKNASETGWVFGTFIYDASHTGNSVWERMVPVGLSWGDDPGVKSMIHTEGAFHNPDLRQSYLNQSLIEAKGRTYTNEAYMRHHGLGGRLNGPVDNPISSCISCHGRAAVTQVGEPMTQGNFALTRSTFSEPDFDRYFSTIQGGSNPISEGNKHFITLDYSLQLATGIRNYHNSLSKNNSKLNTESVLPEVNRGEKLSSECPGHR